MGAMKAKDLPVNSSETLYVEAKDEGAYLYTRMKQLQYSVTDLAKALGVSRTTMYDVFNGKYSLTRDLMARFNAIDPEREAVAMWRIDPKPKRKKSNK